MTIDDAGSWPVEATEPLTAGRFSALTMLSAKALRIYAERGLLRPRRTDPDTGYRYYGADQVRVGWLIGLLRSAGLSLDEIGPIVEGDRPTRLRHFERAVAGIERRTEAVHAVLDRARLHLQEETSVSPIATALEADRPVLSVIRRMRPQEMETVVPREVTRLRALATAAGRTVTGDPFGVFHGPVTDDADGPLEIALPLDDLVDTDEVGVRCYRLPGGMVATRYTEGRETWFPEILARYDEVHAWITDAGRTPVGPPREVWHNGPHDPEPLRLTIVWPYAVAPA